MDGRYGLTSLRDMSYAFGVHVELSRHSFDAPRMAKAAFDFLRSALTR